jgi:hypothetical protein
LNRSASAASQTSPARHSAQNTAAEPKSLISPICGCRSRVTWSASFSIAVFSNSTASTANSAPIIATYQPTPGASHTPSGSASASSAVSSRSAASVRTPWASPRSVLIVALRSRFTASVRLAAGGGRPFETYDAASRQASA